MVAVSSPAPTTSHAFHEHDTAAKQSSRFLGVVPIKYIRTSHGLFHALVSTTALLLGNYLFVLQVVLNRRNDEHLLFARKYFFLCNFLSGAVTMLFFWNKVQSWQLSTTSMKEKGLTAKQMQNFNRGRGVVTPVLLSILPLMMYYDCMPGSLFPNDYFLAHVSELIVSLIIIVIATQIHLLVRDYSKGIFLVYGFYPAGLAATALARYGGSMTTLFHGVPGLLDAYEKDAIFVLTCVQYGFFWYYFYSRRLVSKEFVQVACKKYHPMMMLVYFGRLTADSWWSSNLPIVIKVHSLLTTMLVFFLLVKVVKAKFSGVSAKVVSNATVQQKRRLSRRRSSLFEAVLD